MSRPHDFQEPLSSVDIPECNNRCYVKLGCCVKFGPFCSADTPTEAEVVYRHIDTKLHPLRLQLDSSLLVALSGFFKVKAPAGHNRSTDEHRLDRALGLSALERAGAHLPLLPHC